MQLKLAIFGLALLGAIGTSPANAGWLSGGIGEVIAAAKTPIQIASEITVEPTKLGSEIQVSPLDTGPLEMSPCKIKRRLCEDPGPAIILEAPLPGVDLF